MAKFFEIGHEMANLATMAGAILPSDKHISRRQNNTNSAFVS